MSEPTTSGSPEYATDRERVLTETLRVARDTIVQLRDALNSDHENFGEKTAESMQEWELHPPIVLSHWQVRMVLVSLAQLFDNYHEKRPSDGLPAVRAVARDEVVALLQATINDIAVQAGLVKVDPSSVVSPTSMLVPR